MTAEEQSHMANEQDEQRYLISRRHLVGGAVAGAAALAFGAQALAAPSSRVISRGVNQDGGATVIIGTLGEASTINPFLTNESEGDWRCGMLFDRFVRIDTASYAPAPGIASEWTIDGLTFTFKIRPEAKFSDGTAVTADDIAFTLKGHINPATGSTRQGRYLVIAGAQEYADGTATEVSGIVVSDPQTIAITLVTPDSSFLLNLRYVYPVPMAALDGKNLADDEWFQTPVGAGPFVFQKWDNGADFVATKNTNFWEVGKPSLDSFTHRVIADSQSIVLAILARDIDTSIYPAPTAAEELRADADLNVMVPPFNSPQGWMFNFKNEWLAKKEVRRAIAMALNTEQFAADSLMGLGKPGIGPIAPDSWAYDQSLVQVPYDVEGAKALIAESGMPEGTEIRFTVNQGNVLREDWLTYTEQALKEIGIKVIAEPQEYATLVDAITVSQDYDCCGVDFTGVTVDPGELYDQFASGASGNYTGYSNPELDALMLSARQELDIEKAKEIYTQIQAIFMDELPVFYAWYRPFLHVVDKTKFAGYVDSAYDNGLYETLQNWTVVS